MQPKNIAGRKIGYGTLPEFLQTPTIFKLDRLRSLLVWTPWRILALEKCPSLSPLAATCHALL
jgi:hypothetical protein